MANTLRELGYIVVVPDYRKYPQVKVDAMYDDVRQALRWTYANANEIHGDREELYMMVNFYRVKAITIYSNDNT